MLEITIIPCFWLRNGHCAFYATFDNILWAGKIVRQDIFDGLIHQIFGYGLFVSIKMLLNTCYYKTDAFDNEIDVVSRLPFEIVCPDLHLPFHLVPMRILDAKPQCGLVTLTSKTPREPDGALAKLVGPIL